MATRRISHNTGFAAIPASSTMRAGWIVSGLVILFLLVDGIMKVLRMDVSVEATVEFGYPESQVAWIGFALLICTLLYAMPRTAILGSILLTGYLGGAIATQVRIEEPAFLFAALIGVLAWVGLAMRDDRTRALFRAPS